MLENAAIIVYIILAILIISLILLNKGKGSEIGANFTTSQESILGTQSSNTFIKKIIAILSIMFIILNITITNAYKNNIKPNYETVDISTNDVTKDELKNIK